MILSSCGRHSPSVLLRIFGSTIPRHPFRRSESIYVARLDPASAVRAGNDHRRSTRTFAFNLSFPSTKRARKKHNKSLHGTPRSVHVEFGSLIVGVHELMRSAEIPESGSGRPTLGERFAHRRHPSRSRDRRSETRIFSTGSIQGTPNSSVAVIQPNKPSHPMDLTLLFRGRTLGSIRDR